MEVCACK